MNEIKKQFAKIPTNTNIVLDIIIKEIFRLLVGKSFSINEIKNSNVISSAVSVMNRPKLLCMIESKVVSLSMIATKGIPSLTNPPSLPVPIIANITKYNINMVKKLERIRFPRLSSPVTYANTPSIATNASTIVPRNTNKFSILSPPNVV